MLKNRCSVTVVLPNGKLAQKILCDIAHVSSMTIQPIKMYAYEVSKTTVGGCQDFGGTPVIL